MGLQRTDDKTKKVIGEPFYRAQIVVTRIDKTDINGTPQQQEEVANSLTDHALAVVNAILDAAGQDMIVEPTTTT